MDEATSTIIIVVLATGLLGWAWWLGQLPAFLFRFSVTCGATLALWWLGEQAFARLPAPWGMIVCLGTWLPAFPLTWWTLRPIEWGLEDYYAERDAQEEEEEEPAPDPAQVIQANVQALARRRQ